MSQIENRDFQTPIDQESELSKLEQIAEEQGITNIKDAFGKTLLLQAILEDMGEEKANEFMKDTLDMMQDEIEAYEVGTVANPKFDLGCMFGDVHGDLDGLTFGAA